ncbi:LacI family DNA-binding transcriptional regulator [Pseudomonas silesiensis]|uniref:LacI family DNA-binding transcriptional regulator n=1 Tax=Pseudomonas silesiensis TaxID=1853130 RepID=UPI0034D3BDD1
MNAKMSDVAQAANVSMSTVSHVLNGTRKVDPDTAAKVNQAVEAVGYIRNTLARSLARSSSGTIGVAIATLSNHYFSETVRAIETACTRSGLMMILIDTKEDPEQELKAVRALHERRVDGIILASAYDPENRVLNYLTANKVPTVLVDRLVSTAFDQVGVENKNSSQKLISHLIKLGHRRIGMVSGRLTQSTSHERIDGYRAALADAGVPYEDQLVCCGESTIQPAMEATRRLLSLENPPTAIMTANNLMTIGAMQAIREAGLEVPKDIALVGFDDFDWADAFSPRLTVVAQPLEELGAQAVKLLLKRIKLPDGRRQTIRLEPSFVQRDSCGALK